MNSFIVQCWDEELLGSWLKKFVSGSNLDVKFSGIGVYQDTFTFKYYTIAYQSTRRYTPDNKRIQNDEKKGDLEKKSLWPVFNEGLNTGSQRISTKGP